MNRREYRPRVLWGLFWQGPAITGWHFVERGTPVLLHLHLLFTHFPLHVHTVAPLAALPVFCHEAWMTDFLLILNVYVLQQRKVHNSHIHKVFRFEAFLQYSILLCRLCRKCLDRLSVLSNLCIYSAAQRLVLLLYRSWDIQIASLFDRELLLEYSVKFLL